MLDSVCHTLSAAAAWWLALVYIHTKTSMALFHALLAAALCGAGSFCLHTVSLTSLIPLVSLAVFLFTTLAIQMHRRENCGDAVLAFLLAQGGYSLITFSGAASLHYAGIWGLVPACMTPAIFLLLTCKLRSLFPASDWREYYHETAPEPGRIRLTLVYNYLIAAGVCTVMAVGTLSRSAGSMLPRWRKTSP